MDDSEENYKFDLGVKGLKMTKIDKITILCNNWQLNAHRLAQKVLITLILGGKKMYLSLLQILCLVLWIVNTSGEQCKQAIGTQQKVITTT